MRNCNHKLAIEEISDLMHYMSSGLLNYTSVAKKTGFSIEELSSLLKNIAEENAPKSKFHDLDIDGYLSDFESTNYTQATSAQ